jgi:hypothetical protein
MIACLRLDLILVSNTASWEPQVNTMIACLRLDLKLVSNTASWEPQINTMIACLRLDLKCSSCLSVYFLFCFFLFCWGLFLYNVFCIMVFGVCQWSGPCYNCGPSLLTLVCQWSDPCYNFLSCNLKKIVPPCNWLYRSLSTFLCTIRPNHLRLPDFNLCNQINQRFSWGTLHRIYNKNVSVYLFF